MIAWRETPAALALRAAGHGPDSNAVASDNVEGPAKIRLRFDQGQREVSSLFGRFWRDAEQDHTAAGRKSAPEDEFAEIVVECQKDCLLVRTETGDFFIWYTWAFFRNREDLPTRLSQRVEGRPRKIFICQESHAVFRG